MMMVNIKIREKKEFAFRAILKGVGLTSVSEKIEADNKMKGKVLMNLKEYPRLNLKRAFWKWYLTTTDKGENLFQTVSDNLVLYTHTNKENVYYRLFKRLKGKRRKVSPKMKKMAFTLSLISKIFFYRNLREGFEGIKYNGKPQRLVAI